MAELLVKGITEMSYQECAAKVNEMTSQTISTMGVWNVIQALGEKVCEKEAEKEVPVLFKEAEELIRYYRNNEEPCVERDSQTDKA